ncbi:MAG TPA: hypothetical protein VF797_14855 [Noviherbaspirillum sp.]
MDKSSPSKEMSLASPLSAGALYQFLSSQRADRGLKIKNAYTAPVLKTREKSEHLNEEQRKAWAFYLKEIHQRQTGTEEAENASAQIESFLKSDAARATAGTLLGPVAALMKAEQVCIQKSSSTVRRWMANEQKVQEIAISTDERDANVGQITQYKNALTFARQMLARFPDFQHGEIDIELFRDRAYSLGSVLSENDMQHLQKARVIIAKRAQQLADYIGPEVPLLIELCMTAKGANLEDYRTADTTKNLCLELANKLRARTDNDEYVVPISPRSADKRTNLKASVPSITGYSAVIVHPGDDGHITAPSSRTSGSALSQQLPADAGLPTSPVTKRSLPRSVTEGTSAALVVELKGQHKQQLAHSVTSTESTSPRQAGDYSPYRPLQLKQQASPTGDAAVSTKATGHARSASNVATPTQDAVKKSSKEKRKRHRSMQYEAPLGDADHGRKHRHAEKERSSQGTEKPDRAYKEKRKAQETRRRSQPEGTELKALQQQPALALKSQMKKRTDIDATLDVFLAARGNNAIPGKWDALQGKLGSPLPADGRAVVNKMLPYWKGVDLHKLDKTLFSSLVLAAGMSRKDRTALKAVRDVLLADSLQGQQSVAAAVFPELLTLVIYSIDAHRNLPKATS